jgi:glycosyltransferase involved in cell wall biosynthesis
VTRELLSVAYFVDTFPVLSQTFVSEEVAELRRQGVSVLVMAQMAGDRSLPTQADVALTDLPTGWLRLRAEHLTTALRSPRRYAEFRRRVRRVRTETGLAELQFAWRLLPRDASGVRRNRAQLLHAHFAWGAAAGAYCLAALTDLPWTVTVHANDIYAGIRNLELKLAEADRVITPCEYNRRFLADELGLTRPVDLVVCGVVPPPGPPRPPEHDVVAVGRLVPKKGFDVLVRAAARLRTLRPDLQVLIVGEGPEREALETLIVALGLERTVVLTGARPHDEVLDLIARARVFCLPARIAPDGDRDAMPVVVKEAMARYVPVVGTDVVGMPEMVDDQVGRLVPEDDDAALARALHEVLGLAPKGRGDLGTAGRRRVEERFTLEGETARLRQVFEETVAAR